MKSNKLRGLVIAATLAGFVAGFHPAQGFAAEFNLSGLTRTVGGKVIGPQSFNIIKQTTFKNSFGVPYVWVEMGVSGTLEGYTALKGMRYETFTDFPDLVLRGRNNFEPYYHGTTSYSAQDGTRLEIIFPASKKDWNGKIFSIAHVAGAYQPIGIVGPAGTDKKLNSGQGIYFQNLMIDKGYAVLFSMRSSSNQTGVGPSTVTLDDGRVLNNKALGMHAGLFHDLTMVGKKYVEDRLGAAAKRMYFYGKSQGGNLGRMFNYAPGANVDYKDPSKKLFDGFIFNSPGGGLFLPVLYKDGKDGPDSLFRTDESKKNFAPQIDILKNIYPGEQFIENAYWGTYYEVNRDNQRILNRKGLGKLSRTYELQGASHEEGDSQNGKTRHSEYLPTKDSLNMNPESGGFMDAVIDLLDNWVDKGVAPPATRSNSYDLGDVNGDGILDNPAISLPEIACPVGVYYLFPKGQEGSGNLGFAAFTKEDFPVWNKSAATTSKGEQTKPENFDEAWLEPLDNFGRFVDMNGNGVRDTRESVTKAWRRRATEGYKTGTLPYDGTITHDIYVNCITKDAEALKAQSFMSERGLRSYIEAANNSPIGK